jgi:sugar lactone lactonase YvrE
MTILGSGIAGSSPSGTPATSAMIRCPRSITFDSNNDYYFSDSGNHLVRKVANGILYTVAGISEVAGYSGDGIAATSSRLNYPYGVAVNTNGVLFIADSFNFRIRQVSTAGIVTTLLGTGTASTIDGPLTSATINIPTGLFMRPDGNMYVSDMNGNRIRLVNFKTNIISTVIGSGARGSSEGTALTATMNSPLGLFQAANGDIYFCDAGNGRIRMYRAGSVTSSIAFSLANPHGVAVDSSGAVFYTDTNNGRVSSFDFNLDSYITIAGGGTDDSDSILATNAAIFTPTEIVLDPQSTQGFIISECSSDKIRRLYIPTPGVSPTAEPTLSPSRLPTVRQTGQPTGM